MKMTDAFTMNFYTLEQSLHNKLWKLLQENQGIEFQVGDILRMG